MMREVVPVAPQRGAADRNAGRRLGREHLLDARIAVERDVLVVEDGIRIGHRARHERARVGGRRRHDDLEPGRPVEPGFGVLAVIWTGVPQAAPRHANDHRHGSAPAIPDLGRVVHELIEPGRDEIIELHLADRPLAGERGADAGAQHGPFGERRVDDAIAELLEQRAKQQKRVAVRAADIFAEDEDLRVGAQGITDAEHHGFEQRAAGAIERRVSFERRQRRVGVEVQPHLRIENLDPHTCRLAGENPFASLCRGRPRGSDHLLRGELDDALAFRLQAAELVPVDELLELQPRRVRRESDRAPTRRHRDPDRRSPSHGAAGIPSLAAIPCRGTACRRGARGRTCASRRAR